MSISQEGARPRVLLLTTSRSYRNAAFTAAADRLGIEIVLGVDVPEALNLDWDEALPLQFTRVRESVAAIARFHGERPLRAILPVDDRGAIHDAAAAESLYLPHNAPAAAQVTRDKLLFRQLLSSGNLNNPPFREYLTGDSLQPIIDAVGFPCVVKPRSLNGSRGVIRADNRSALEAAVARSARLMRRIQGDPPSARVSLLIEAYIPGKEFALEGLMEAGQLRLLALFDKPDPLEGPFFEETIYVTPSRLSAAQQDDLLACTAEAARAMGLQTGPVHAEMRLNEAGPWLLEIAGRSIGGLCGQVLQFGTRGTLEEVILRQACAMAPISDIGPAQARGVMMIPIPAAGLLRAVEGLEEAQQTPLISSIEITTPLNYPVTPLPKGDGYLGFIFAAGSSPEEVEHALREAHRKLRFKIDTMLPILQ
jgi:biotin carboxylase